MDTYTTYCIKKHFMSVLSAGATRRKKAWGRAGPLGAAVLTRRPARSRASPAASRLGLGPSYRCARPPQRPTRCCSRSAPAPSRGGAQSRRCGVCHQRQLHVSPCRVHLAQRDLRVGHLRQRTCDNLFLPFGNWPPGGGVWLMTSTASRHSQLCSFSPSSLNTTPREERVRPTSNDRGFLITAVSFS